MKILIGIVLYLLLYFAAAAIAIGYLGLLWKPLEVKEQLDFLVRVDPFLKWIDNHKVLYNISYVMIWPISIVTTMIMGTTLIIKVMRINRTEL